jgi:glucose-6-phosphate dehydrogenase assembly protein OpcA
MSDALQAAADVSFADIESALALRDEHTGMAAPPRALTATIVAVGPDARVAEAARPLQRLAESGGVRAIAIAHGSSSETRARVSAGFVALEGLPPEFIDNAVAAIRLSSLPTIVWWRGGAVEVLDRVVALADRVVLDVEAPEKDLWPHVITILDRTAFSDLRWTRLTRWRALTAQLFDLPGVAAAAASFTELRIEGADRPTARLFAGWLQTSLEWKDSVKIDIVDSRRDAPIEAVNLTSDAIELRVCLAGSRQCVETSARVPGQAATSRVVSLGSQGLESLLSEELRIRSRDAAFERALRACLSS